jgi:hypothetical protein
MKYFTENVLLQKTKFKIVNKGKQDYYQKIVLSAIEVDDTTDLK